MKPRVPQTYDEITRRTVLEPDGSRRADPHAPTPTADDQRLRATIADALSARGLTEVGVEVDDGRVILRGWIRDGALVASVVSAVTSVAPEVEIVDRMHIGLPT